MTEATELLCAMCGFVMRPSGICGHCGCTRSVPGGERMETGGHNRMEEPPVLKKPEPEPAKEDEQLELDGSDSE